MSSVKAQADKVLKLNVNDKKLARLLNFQDLSQRDTLFLNYVYEEKQELYFKYGILFTVLSSVVLRLGLVKHFSKTTSNLTALGVAVVSNGYWNSIITKRFNKFVEPYFEKYSIK